jgi:hypothetical protein
MVAVLGIGVFVTYTRMLQAQYDMRVAEANQRALTAEVQEWQSKAELADSLRTVARSLFQLQQEIDSDSIASLASALGTAVREQELTVRALERVEVELDRVSASNVSLVDMLGVLSPTGRPEDLHVHQLEGPPIQGEIVVTVPLDTTLQAEWETRLEVTPFALTYALGCTPEGDASANFEAPPWVSVTPQRGSVDPLVCQGPRPTFGGGIQFTLGNALVWGGLGTLAGFVIGALVGR